MMSWKALAPRPSTSPRPPRDSATPFGSQWLSRWKAAGVFASCGSDSRRDSATSFGSWIVTLSAKMMRTQSVSASWTSMWTAWNSVLLSLKQYRSQSRIDSLTATTCAKRYAYWQCGLGSSPQCG
jgi:hypothetical protein